MAPVISTKSKSLQWLKIIFDLFTPALILLVPLVNFLQYNDYYFLSPEVLIMVISFLAIGLASSLVGKFGGRIVKVLAYSVILTIFLDLQFESLPFVNKREFSKEFIFIGFIISFGLAFILGKRVSIILGAGFATVILMTVFLPVESRPDVLIRNEQSLNTEDVGQDKLPLYLHIVLDAHIGLEGLPEEIAEAQILKQKLKTFYHKNKFTIYGSAYSQHFDTAGSLAQVFSLSPKIDRSEGGQGNLEYLYRLEKMGFSINSYSTYELNHCTDKRINYASCYFYDALAISHVKSLGLEMSERLTVLIKSFLYRSLIYQKLSVEANKMRKGTSWFSSMVPYWNWERNVRVQPVASMKTLEALKEALKQAAPGDMFLAHLLTPHAPYIYSSSCHTGKLETWFNRIPLTGVNTPVTRRTRYLSYIQQVGCTLQKIQEIVDILKERNLYNEAIIVIHGDHGSRISVVEPGNRSASNPMTDSDFRDGYSTLAAIKIPNTEAGYEQAPIAISQLISKFVLGKLSALPVPKIGSDNEVVFMRNVITRKLIPIKRDFLSTKK